MEHDLMGFLVERGEGKQILKILSNKFSKTIT